MRVAFSLRAFKSALTFQCGYGTGMKQKYREHSQPFPPLEDPDEPRSC